MKTLYLHIGTPKTATTAIQRFCEDNQSILNKYGYDYPAFAYRYSNVGIWRNGHFLVGKMFDEEGKRDFAREDAIFEEGFRTIYELFEKYDNIVLSDEGIWHFGIKGRTGFLERMQRELEKGRFTLKIIVYLRRQDDFLYSWWNQQVKEGMHPSSVFNWERMTKELPFIKLDYYSVLEQYAGVAGRENIIVRLFDRNKFFGNSIHADFLNAIGLQFSDEWKLSDEVQNLSLTKNDNEIKRILNEIPALDAKSNQVFRKVLQDCSEYAPDDNKYGMFSKEETAEFLSQYEEGNRKIAKEYLGTEAPLFSDEYKAQEKWDADNPEMRESVIRFVGNLAVYIVQENEKLQNENKELKKAVKTQKSQIDWIANIIRHPVKAVARKMKNVSKTESHKN